MPTSISLLIAYPKELIRAGLRAMVEKTGIKIVAETDTIASALTLAKKHQPTVVMLDACSTAGRDYKAVKQIRASVPEVKFLFLAALENPTYLARAKAVGASNVLLESVATRDFVVAIENAAAGKPTKPTEPFTQIATAMMGRANLATEKAGLTPREIQVLAHAALGVPNDEISQSLTIKFPTVVMHLGRVMQKLGFVERTQAAIWAVKSGVV